MLNIASVRSYVGFKAKEYYPARRVEVQYLLVIVIKDVVDSQEWFNFV